MNNLNTSTIHLLTLFSLKKDFVYIYTCGLSGFYGIDPLQICTGFGTWNSMLEKYYDRKFTRKEDSI